MEAKACRKHGKKRQQGILSFDRILSLTDLFPLKITGASHLFPGELHVWHWVLLSSSSKWSWALKNYQLSWKSWSGSTSQAGGMPQSTVEQLVVPKCPDFPQVPLNPSSSPVHHISSKCWFSEKRGFHTPSKLPQVTIMFCGQGVCIGQIPIRFAFSSFRWTAVPIIQHFQYYLEFLPFFFRTKDYKNSNVGLFMIQLACTATRTLLKTPHPLFP